MKKIMIVLDTEDGRSYWTGNVYSSERGDALEYNALDGEAAAKKADELRKELFFVDHYVKVIEAK